jgi:hypothetical protein
VQSSTRARKEKALARKAADTEFEDLDLEDEDFDVEEEEETKAKKKGKGASSKQSDKPKGIGATALAEHLGAEPKTFRAWLRRQVEAGKFPELSNREAKSRYDFGASVNSPTAQKIIKAWNSESHEKGAGLEKAQAARQAKQAGKTKAKAKAKKSS